MSDEEISAPKRPEIVDPHHVDALFTDWVVTHGLYEGVVNITFAALDFSFRESAATPPRAVITHRMRLSRDFAARLHQMLGSMLGVDPPQTGQDAPPMPTNTIN